jgi:hypothetical protein
MGTSLDNHGLTAIGSGLTALGTAIGSGFTAIGMGVGWGLAVVGLGIALGPTLAVLAYQSESGVSNTLFDHSRFTVCFPCFQEDTSRPQPPSRPRPPSPSPSIRQSSHYPEVTFGAGLDAGGQN